MSTQERNGWRTAGLLAIGALAGVAILVATAKAVKHIEEERELEEIYTYEPTGWWERFKAWLANDVLMLGPDDYSPWRMTSSHVFAAIVSTAVGVVLFSALLGYLLPRPTFDLTLSPVRVWVTGDAAALPKANITVVASGNTLEKDGVQLEYIVTDIATGKVVATGDFENRLYIDIGFDRGQAAASYRIDVILMRPGHDPWSKSRVFNIPSAAALPNS